MAHESFDKEIQFLRMLALTGSACSRQQYAERLGISVHTFDKMMKRLKAIAAMSGKPLTVMGLLDCGSKDGRTHSQEGAFPYKLEYSMVKREWYLLWLHRRQRLVMSTRLANIAEIEERPLAPELAGRLVREAKQYLAAHMATAVIRVGPAYNAELSRILYAFSRFEREIEYDEAADVYSIRLRFANGETEYVLSKIRFLGMRVQVAENDRLRGDMRQTAAWALERYGEEAAT